MLFTSIIMRWLCNEYYRKHEINFWQMKKTKVSYVVAARKSWIFYKNSARFYPLSMNVNPKYTANAWFSNGFILNDNMTSILLLTGNMEIHNHSTKYISIMCALLQFYHLCSLAFLNWSWFYHMILFTKIFCLSNTCCLFFLY